MIFIQNKYTNWYFNIIRSAQSRITNNYTEKHHIIPHSMGGSNNLTNLVKLTAREHFICHWLLTKMTDNKNYSYKMYHAMLLISNRYSVTSHTYQKIKEQISKSKKNKSYIELYGEEKAAQIKAKLSISRCGKPGKPHTAETKKKLSIAAKNRPKGRPAWNKDIPHSDYVKQKISNSIRVLMNNLTAAERSVKFGLIGNKNGFYNKKHSQKTIKHLSIIQQNNRLVNRTTCPYCNRNIDNANYARYHGNKCKLK